MKRKATTTLEKELTSLQTAEQRAIFPAAQLHKLESFGDKLSEFGVDFALCDADGEFVLFKPCDNGTSINSTSREKLLKISRETIRQYNNQSQSGKKHNVYRFDEPDPVLTVPLNSGSEVAAIALISLSDAQFQANHILFEQMLSLLADNFSADAKAERHIEKISNELANVYEELVLLHKISTNMKVTEPDANFLQMACDSLTDIVTVEGIAVLLEKQVDGHKQLMLAAGSGLIDINEQTKVTLHNRLLKELNDSREALLDSEVDSPFRYDWPDDINSIIAVPLWGKGKPASDFTQTPQTQNPLIGLMVAVNRVDKPDFDSIDVKLFNSVANGCAVFVENSRLFRDLKELFIGSLKALTSSIDAKDQYTRGHSDRVAFISRWIAEKIADQFQLDQQRIHKIYLTGLLHDIGKMGVNESILRKKGRLTQTELNHIRAHPSIGAGILSGIRQMSDIVPGVLYHHERIDGKWYPHRLAGDQIPLIAKIIGLADSFDAMTSKRTYRAAMTIEQALTEIKQNSGTQFDENIATAFINSDVYQLWEIMQNGFGQVYGSNNLSESGTAAVGALIR